VTWTAAGSPGAACSTLSDAVSWRTGGTLGASITVVLAPAGWSHPATHVDTSPQLQKRKIAWLTSNSIQGFRRI
jgi:hypothetical protein